MNALSSNLSALTLLIVSSHGSAEVIYSNFQNITIPTTYAGVYIDVDGGQAPSTAAFTGWDLNAYMGGIYLANNSSFQPGRTAANDMGTLQNFAVGSTIDTNLLLGTGMGGSIDHLGTTFTAGTEGYLGFKNGANYGWMRVVFTGNTSGAVVKDWAYDTSGATIAVGRVQQSAVSEGAQVVTLSPGSGESFTLGSQITNTGGNINSVLKTGTGAVILTGTNSHSGATTVSSGRLTIGSGATINSTSGVVIGAGEFNYNSSSALTQGVSFSGTSGTLSGSGTITPAVTISSGNLHSAGEVRGAGAQSFGSDLTYASASIFQWDLNASNGVDPGILANSGVYDQVIVGSDLGGAGAVFKIVLGSNGFGDAFWNTHKTWNNIFSAANSFDLGTLFSSFSGADIAANGSVTGQGAFTLSGNTLTWTAVPEPSSALGGILLGLGLLRRRRESCLDIGPQ